MPGGDSPGDPHPDPVPDGEGNHQTVTHTLFALAIFHV
jgi:hypothetical protein